MAKFRILSLDGGGSWSLLQIMALQAIYSENAKGHDVLKAFDLVAANSGGSVALGGLIENLSLKDLLSTYFLDATKRRDIFVSIGTLESLEDKLYDLVGIAPRYSTAGKLEGLRSLLPAFGTTPLPSIPGRIAQNVGQSPHFLIAAFDYDRKRSALFRSNVRSAAASFAPAPVYSLAEAIDASSTAPIRYFDAPAVLSAGRYWDGAIAGYNNPILAAVTEALANKIPPQEIRVLSIGTGTVRRPPGSSKADDPILLQPAQDPGPKTDLAELAESILDDPPDAATFIAHVALQQPMPDPNRPSVPALSNIVRLNPMIQPDQKADGTWTLPPGLSETDFSVLVDLGLDALAQDEVMKIRSLGTAWITGKVANQPIRSNSATFHCEIGDALFSQGISRWKEFMND